MDQVLLERNTVPKSRLASAVPQGILGTGSALPVRRIDNAELSRLVDTSDEWIRDRVGIQSRHVASPFESTLGLAADAAKNALSAAKLSAAHIDLILFATASADEALPSCAARLQAELGCKKAMSFDLQAACSGFLFALAAADGLMHTHGFQRALVIGSETLSRIVDWRDRTTCVLFGDGAGAVVYTAPPRNSGRRSSIEAVSLTTNAELHHLITRSGTYPPPTLPGGKDEYAAPGYVQMNGTEVFKAGVQAMCSSIEEVLQKAGRQIEEVDYFIPHQSNSRMIDSVRSRIGMPAQLEIVTNIDRIGNTSAASIPIALDEHVRAQGIPSGSLLLMTAVGAGISYGSILIRWP